MIGALVLSLAQSKPAAADPLTTDLAAAVDRPAQADRAKAAAELAARKEVPVAEWLRAMKAFGSFEKAATGPSTERAALRVGDATEETEICTFVPASYDPAKPAPLLLTFHGTGGSGEGMDGMWRGVAQALGMVVVAPSEAGPNEGYAFSPRERLSALAALRRARRRFNVDENRVFLSGISRGGHLTWDVGLRWPDRFAALAPMIGGPRMVIGKSQNNLRFLEAAAPLSIRDLQGSKDDPKLVADLRYAFERLKKLKAPDAKLLEFPELGHSFDPGAVDWPAFLGASVRKPIPSRVVARSVGKAEGRAYWVEILTVRPSIEEEFVPKIDKSKWDVLSDDGKRKWMNEEAEKRTARLEVTMTAPGKFTATGSGVASFRLLLSSEMFDPAQPVTVSFEGKTVKRTLAPDARVLLGEFVERFDRTFLPIAEIRVP